MPASSSLKIAAQSVTRLVKDEASYHKELGQQEKRITSLKQDTSDENAEYLIKQETRAMDETRAMFPELKRKIEEAVAKLERELESGEGASAEDVEQAQEALKSGKAAVSNS